MAHSRAEGRQCEQLAHGREVKVSTFAHVTVTLSSKFKMTAYSSFPSLIPIAPVVCLTETSPRRRPRKWKKSPGWADDADGRSGEGASQASNLRVRCHLAKRRNVHYDPARDSRRRPFSKNSPLVRCLVCKPKGGRRQEEEKKGRFPPLASPYRNRADRLTSASEGGGRDGWGNMLIKKFN